MAWEMAKIGLAFSLILGMVDCLSAQQPKESGTPPQIPPIIPGFGMPMMQPQPFGGMKKSDSQAPPLAPYPMFQIMGPPLLIESNPADPTTMGNLLRLQGELMIKMGEVMMKHGQMMLEQNKQGVGPSR